MDLARPCRTTGRTSRPRQGLPPTPPARASQRRRTCRRETCRRKPAVAHLPSPTCRRKPAVANLPAHAAVASFERLRELRTFGSHPNKCPEFSESRGREVECLEGGRSSVSRAGGRVSRGREVECLEGGRSSVSRQRGRVSSGWPSGAGASGGRCRSETWSSARRSSPSRASRAYPRVDASGGAGQLFHESIEACCPKTPSPVSAEWHAVPN